MDRALDYVYAGGIWSGRVMKIVHRSVINFKEGRQERLALFCVEHTVFRWVIETSGKLFDGIDFLDALTAIKHLRVRVETEVKYIGADLTFIPVALPPEERAAKRIINEIVEGVAPNKYGEEVVAGIIREETAIGSLLEHVNLLVTYRLQRMRQPKPPGLDMAEGGLLLSVIEDIEIAQQVDLSGLKSLLTGNIDRVKLYASAPTGGKPS